MSKVIYEKDGRIGRVTLNRPDVLNAIDDESAENTAQEKNQRDSKHAAPLNPPLVRYLQSWLFVTGHGAESKINVT
jgi:hypothetical protein